MRKINFLFILILVLAAVVSTLVIWRLFIYQPAIPTQVIPAVPLSPTPIQTFTTSVSITPSISPISPEKGESSASLLESLKEKFPLIEFLPYKTQDFDIDYKAPLTLKVKIKTAIASSEINQEITNWIRSKGVDPATHKIEFVTPAP